MHSLCTAPCIERWPAQILLEQSQLAWWHVAAAFCVENGSSAASGLLDNPTGLPASALLASEPFWPQRHATIQAETALGDPPLPHHMT
jgi:hypothetical protein